MEVKIETSGMDSPFERTARDLAIYVHLHMQEYTQDQKAKHVVKEFERRHGFQWACMAEATKQFVQCFGVTQRPD